ncbi:HAD family hydrolase [Trueperella bialowiezensis]|uniref:Phosphorylated carbohydrates phosphatase TM_1254 n=1 Tax=Trueperella bialowiezensis TaxID=312285 RepID=A0A3S5EW00_9ACTO|nr:HAD family phosphatase [Trueperella bialowiezensis]VEI12858.1 Phosphorylated carbohydrates phosphatase TM_1254 [Trueperella bialowiezensis]
MAVNDVFAQLGFEGTPAAVLWDMDGTIMDSEAEWVEMTAEVVLAVGGVWDDDDSVYIAGANSHNHSMRMADAVERGTGTRPDPHQIFAVLSERLKNEVYSCAQLLPGAHELLTAFRMAGIPQALVTATEKELVDVALGALDDTYFNAVVTGTDDVPGKPDPAPYLLGAQRLAADPERCLAFEDSKTGLAAARASGAHVVNVNETPLVKLAAFL